MTTLLTDPVGVLHITQRNTGVARTNAFDAMELGQGNDPLAINDDRSDLDSKIGGSIVLVASGYPVHGDTSIENDGRGADKYTWKFVYAEGTQQILASNAIVTNYAGGAPANTEPILVHSNDVLVKRPDQVLTVFVNVSEAGAATLVAHLEDGEPLTEQVATWRSQSISLSGAPGATPVTNGIVQSRFNEGEQAWIGARILNGEGAVMTHDDVVAVTLTGYKRDREREWVYAHEESLDPLLVIKSAPVRTDPRWRVTQGYNFAHAWRPDGGWGSRRTRLEYTFTLTTGDLRTIVHEIEWASMRAN